MLIKNKMPFSNQGALVTWTEFLEQLRNDLDLAREQLTVANAEVDRLESQVESVQNSILRLRRE